MKDLQISVHERDILLAELHATLELPGDVVEFGCYTGDTSVVLADAMRQYDKKWLWLYDSFEGLPAKSAADYSTIGWRFKAGELKASVESVAHKFRKLNLPDPVIKKAWFNQLDPVVDLPTQICFALLDGDFYDSIKTSLLLVASKLTSGGVMIVHDYRNPALPGSKRAVDEFLEQYSTFHLQLRSSLAIITTA